MARDITNSYHAPSTKPATFRPGFEERQRKKKFKDQNKDWPEKELATFAKKPSVLIK